MYKKNIFEWNDASFINVINNNVSPDSESALESILEHTLRSERLFGRKNLNDPIYLFVRRTRNWWFIFLLNGRYQSGPFKFDVAMLSRCSSSPIGWGVNMQMRFWQTRAADIRDAFRQMDKHVHLWSECDAGNKVTAVSYLNTMW